MSETTVKTNAIVVRSKESGENDRLLTLLSPSMGKLTVTAKGVRSLKHKSRSSVMPLSYSSFVLKKIKDGLYSLTSADLIESFSALSSDVTLLSYGSYFADLCRTCIQSGSESEEEVRLLLNTLYVLCKRRDCAPLLKIVFELKLAELCGIMPDIDEVCPCGENGAFFSVSDGEMRCSLHKDSSCLPISEKEISVLKYIMQSNLKDALFMECDEFCAFSLSKITEAFLGYHLGFLPNSLTFLHNITKKTL